MGLNTLAAILEKRGLTHVQQFLSEEVIISEKLDTYRILFEKQGDKLVFFKKDNTPLNLIERTLTNVWEDAIIELTTIVGDTMIPEGMRFGLSYTPVERPIRIPYSKIPKYILTDITLRKNDKVQEVYEYDEVTRWASLLNIGRPPIIFQGKLNETQIKDIIDYGTCNYDNIEEDNFARSIERLFEKSYSEEDIIEGIIIKNGNELMQVVSYEFNILNEAYKKEEYSRDYYDIVLLNLNSFMDSYSMPVLEGNTPDEMYLSITSDIFNKFCEKNPSILDGISESLLSPPAYGYYGDLNLLLIKNKKTIDILEKGGKIYEALFRIIISSLRKPKKEFGLLNESAIEKFNTNVNVIRNIINDECDLNEHVDDYIENLKKKHSKINESRSGNIVIDVMNRRQATDIDNMRVIASIQKAFEPAMLDVDRGKEKVVVYVTECQPFTTQQLENIRSIHTNWKCPVVLASISNERKTPGEKFHISDEIIRAQLKAVAIFEKDIIPSYFMANSWNLTEVFEYCRPTYEPIAIITDAGKKSQYAVQLYFEDEVMGGRVNVEQNFNVGEMENKDQLPALRAIEDGFISNFKQVTPEPIWGLWDSFVAEYKTWSGQIIVNFKENDFV